jgi:hypothetical protein
VDQQLAITSRFNGFSLVQEKHSIMRKAVETADAAGLCLITGLKPGVN